MGKENSNSKTERTLKQKDLIVFQLNTITTLQGQINKLN